MADFDHSVSVDMDGNVSRRSRQWGRDVDRFSRSGRRSLSLLRKGTQATGRALDRMGNRFTAFATGAAAFATGRGVITLQRRLTRLGIQANVTDERIESLRDNVFDIAQRADFNVDPSQILSAVEEIVEKTGDLKFAEENIQNIAAALGGSGGAGESIGALTAELRKFGITTQKDVLTAIDTLVAQGKSGAFTIANLAQQGERLASAYAATGRQGFVAVQELGAVIQVIRQGTGSSEQAATAFEALLRTLLDADKVKVLQGNGIQIFEPDQPGVMRSVAVIMQEIIKATGGDAVKINEVFDAEAMRAFNASIAEFKQTGATPSLEKFLQIQSDGTQIQADSARAARDMAGAVTALAAAWESFANANLADPVRDLASALNAIDPEQLETIFKSLLIGGGALIAAPKLFRAGAAITRGLRGRRGGAGGALAAAAGATPVIVTNWPAGLGAGGAIGGGGRGRLARAGRAGGLLSRAGRLGGRLLRGSGFLAAGLGAFQLFDALNDDTLTSRQRAGRSGGAVGSTAGTLIGGALGAPLGPLGIAGGAVIGNLIGDAVGEAIGERAVSDPPKEQNVRVRLEVEGPGAGLVTPTAIDTDAGSAEIAVDSGFLLAGS